MREQQSPETHRSQTESPASASPLLGRKDANTAHILIRGLTSKQVLFESLTDPQCS